MADTSALSPVPLPEILYRYLKGESMTQLAAEARVHRATLYRWMMKDCGPEYEELVTDALITRIADADQLMDEAQTACDITRAREHQRYSRMDFERRRPKLYGPKQEVDSHTVIQVTIAQVNQQVRREEARVDITPLIGRSEMHSEPGPAQKTPGGLVRQAGVAHEDSSV